VQRVTAWNVADALLRAHPVRSVHAEELARALTAFEELRVEEGVRLCKAGERADQLFILVSGTVSVQAGAQGEELARVSGPALVGHIGVLSGGPRTADLWTTTPARLGRLRAHDAWTRMDRGDPGGSALRRLLLASLLDLLGRVDRRIAAPQAPAAADVSPSAASWGFDPDLLRAAEAMEWVPTEADRRRRQR
jgi:CRP-like cAMP-binding protein